MVWLICFLWSFCSSKKPDRKGKVEEQKAKLAPGLCSSIASITRLQKSLFRTKGFSKQRCFCWQEPKQRVRDYSGAQQSINYKAIERIGTMNKITKTWKTCGKDGIRKPPAELLPTNCQHLKQTLKRREHIIFTYNLHPLFPQHLLTYLNQQINPLAFTPIPTPRWAWCRTWWRPSWAKPRALQLREFYQLQHNPLVSFLHHFGPAWGFQTAFLHITQNRKANLPTNLVKKASKRVL